MHNTLSFLIRSRAHNSAVRLRIWLLTIHLSAIRSSSTNTLPSKGTFGIQKNIEAKFDEWHCQKPHNLQEKPINKYAAYSQTLHILSDWTVYKWENTEGPRDWKHTLGFDAPDCHRQELQGHVQQSQRGWSGPPRFVTDFIWKSPPALIPQEKNWRRFALLVQLRLKNPLTVSLCLSEEKGFYLFSLKHLFEFSKTDGENWMEKKQGL